MLNMNFEFSFTRAVLCLNFIVVRVRLYFEFSFSQCSGSAFVNGKKIYVAAIMHLLFTAN